MNKKYREEVMEQNLPYLQLILYMGHGVLYRFHLERYLRQIECYCSDEIAKELKIMNTLEIIDYSENGIIKIKKVGIAFLKGLSNSQVKSIGVTERLKHSSYMRNELILKNKLEAESIEEMISNILKFSTLISNELSAMEILKTAYNENAHQQYLDMNEYKSTLFKKSSTNIVAKNTINIRNLAKRGMYISLFEEHQVFVFCLLNSEKIDYTKIVQWYIDADAFIKKNFPTKKPLFYFVVDLAYYDYDINKISNKLIQRIAMNKKRLNFKITIYPI